MNSNPIFSGCQGKIFIPVYRCFDEKFIGSSWLLWGELLEEYTTAAARLQLEKAAALRNRFDPYTAYRNTAGEIEAREAAGRRSLTAQERRERRPARGDENTLFAEGEVWSREYDPETASIKQQLDANRERLDAMDVVARVTALERFSGKNGARNWALQFLGPTGYQVDQQGFGKIHFKKKDIDSGLLYADTNEEKAALAALPQVLKRGIEIGGHGNHKGRSKQTVTFAGSVELNGIRGNMAAVVNLRGNHCYAHRILLPDGTVFRFTQTKNDVIRGLSQGVTDSGSLARTTSVTSEGSITSSFEESNTHEQKNFEENGRPDNPDVRFSVDESGEEYKPNVRAFLSSICH